MAQFPALPLFTDSYLADTDHLSDAEHGLYLKLIIMMWRSPDCRVPDDDEWLARRFRRDADAVRTHMRPVIHEFCECGGGWITQKRLRKEWEWCRNKRAKNAAAAKSRWDKENGACERNAGQAVQPQCPPPDPTPPAKKVDKPPSAGGPCKLPFDALPPEWLGWAAEERGWDEGVASDIWLAFRDYWTNGRGKSQKRTDWAAVWRTWCRKENIKPKGGNHADTRQRPGTGPGSSRHQPNKDDRSKAAVVAGVQQFRASLAPGREGPD